MAAAQQHATVLLTECTHTHTHSGTKLDDARVKVSAFPAPASGGVATTMLARKTEGDAAVWDEEVAVVSVGPGVTLMLRALRARIGLPHVQLAAPCCIVLPPPSAVALPGPLQLDVHLAPFGRGHMQLTLPQTGGGQSVAAVRASSAATLVKFKGAHGALYGPAFLRKLGEDCADIFSMRDFSDTVLRAAAAHTSAGGTTAAVAFDKGVVDAVQQMFAAAGAVSASRDGDIALPVSALRAGIDAWGRKHGSVIDLGSGIPIAWFERVMCIGCVNPCAGDGVDEVGRRDGINKCSLSFNAVVTAVRHVVAKLDEYAMQVNSAVEDALLMSKWQLQ